MAGTLLPPVSTLQWDYCDDDFVLYLITLIKNMMMMMGATMTMAMKMMIMSRIVTRPGPD